MNKIGTRTTLFPTFLLLMICGTNYVLWMMILTYFFIFEKKTTCFFGQVDYGGWKWHQNDMILRVARENWAFLGIFVYFCLKLVFLVSQKLIPSSRSLNKILRNSLLHCFYTIYFIVNSYCHGLLDLDTARLDASKTGLQWWNWASRVLL